MLDNVKSICIIEKIFKNLKNKRKLNIMKYNKKILFRLNINKEHFQKYIILKEFNQKFNTNIEDFDIKELDLKEKDIGNEELNFLMKMEFKGLKK